MKSFILSFASCTALIACGPAPRHSTGGDDVDAPVIQTCTPSAELCDDGIDNDCDGYTDCHDPQCSGVGTCPVCGQITHPLSTPLALPDGAGAGPPYTSPLHFMGFGAAQLLTAPSNIVSVCVNMEHSWMRDLQIEIHSPDMKVLVLNAQQGDSCPMGVCEVYLGQANDSDTAEAPVPGVGADYCWTPTSTKPTMYAYANASMPMLDVGASKEMPPGDYQADGMWTSLIGAPLNGDWSIFVQDKWGADNGFIFSWSITFDPTIVTSCDPPIQ